MTRETIDKLAAETGNPCATISLNTHRTRPDYIKDRIILKNLYKDAEKRVVGEFGKRSVSPWEVFSKKGRVFFTYARDLEGLGDITLKLRY